MNDNEAHDGFRERVMREQVRPDVMRESLVRLSLVSDGTISKEIEAAYYAGFRDAQSSFAGIGHSVDEELNKLNKRIEDLEDFARSVQAWSEAYPPRIFPEPTPEDVHEVCQKLGFGIDRISAMILRGFTKPWGERACEALAR